MATSNDLSSGHQVRDAVSFDEWLPVDWGIVVTSSPSVKWSKKNYSCTSWCGRLWHCMPLKYQKPLIQQHSVTNQKTWILSRPIVRISHLATKNWWYLRFSQWCNCRLGFSTCDSVVGCVAWVCWTLLWQCCWVCSLNLLDLVVTVLLGV